MTLQIFSGKIKTKLLLFLVIISLFLTLVFPGVTKSQDQAPFSIELDTDRCLEELTVKLKNTPLFCIQDTEILLDKKDPKFYEKKAQLLEKAADRFSRKIKLFADQEIKEYKLELSNGLVKSEKRKDNYYYLTISYKKSSESSTDTDEDEIIKIGKISNPDSLEKEELLNKIKEAIKNYRKDLLFSIQDYTDECPEELIVKLDDRKLFCVVNTEKELSDKKHFKYWQEELKVLKDQASSYSKKIKEFADKYNPVKDIDLPDSYKLSDIECTNNNNNNNQYVLPKSKAKDNYYYLPIFYKEDSEYFDDKYNREIIRIGKDFKEKDVSNEWKNKCNLIKRGEKVRDTIRKEIKEYRKSFKLAKPEEQGNNKNQEEQGNNKNQEEQEKIELSNQAVRIKGGNIIFYIRTWNNELSPTERAKKVSEKIEKIVKGEIDIQGLGIFEKSIENTEIENAEDEKNTIQNPKIIKIISDSRFLSEEEKRIIEVTDNDALFARIEGVENAADLAQDYLIKINKFVTEYKNSIKKANKKGYKRGYPVNFLNNPKPIFSINSGSGLFQASYRASLISKRIEKFAQKNLFLKSNRLVAAYPVGEGLNSQDDKNKGLCILPESLKPEDYNKFLANNKPKDNNTKDCPTATLERNDNLALVYSDEISRKINRADWELTNTYIKEKPGEGLPNTIIFMELDKDKNLDKDKDYEHIMNIQVTELDPFLHKKPFLDKNIETKQELAIDFLNKIDNRVREYRTKKRIGFIIFIVLLLIVFQIFFKISPKSIEEPFSRKSEFLRDSKRHLRNFFFKKTTNFFHPNNDKIISLVSKLCILAVILILILYSIPKYDIIISDQKQIYLRFINERLEMVWTYLYAQIPSIVFILITVKILDKIILDKIIFVLDERIRSKEDDNKNTSAINKIIGEVIEKIIKKPGENQRQLEEEQRQSKEEQQRLEKEQRRSNLIIFRTTLVIVRIILYIFTIILIAPHLPAAGTIYFKGISAFVVLAFTWSASSVIADLAAGLILIYGKSLKTGDWIKVEDTIGKIREQNLLFHKIKTAKNHIITIPNSVVFNNFTTNFSASINGESKLILNVTVGLGYDVPRKEIEKTLIAAARKTKNILKWKSDNSKNYPSVLITNLGDFAVTYELNVYTEKPEQIPQIYSDLQKNIQDECNSRGIEILSPSYLALRDGGDTTIPEEYNKPKLFGLERLWRYNNSKGIK